jgi:hypothetical protein
VVWWGRCGLHSLWLVLLESAKDQLLGVDTPELSMSGMKRLAY